MHDEITGFDDTECPKHLELQRFYRRSLSKKRYLI